MTATVTDPMCKPSTTQSCKFRLEGFQISLEASTALASRSRNVTFEDAVLGSTGPFAGSETGNGSDIRDASLFAASFGKNGDRAPLLEAKGFTHVLIFPQLDGTVRLSLDGTYQGYVDGRKGTLRFFASGKTPQLFDASAPDAKSDAPNDGATESDVDHGDGDGDGDGDG